MALGNGVAEAPATHLKGALFALGSPPRGALLGTAQRHRARRPPAVCARCAVCPTPSPASAAATTRAPAGSITPPSPDAPPPAARRGARAETAAPQKKKGCERALEEPCGRESALQPCPAAWHAWNARVETPPWLDSPHRGAKPSRQGGQSVSPAGSTPSAASWWARNLGGERHPLALLWYPRRSTLFSIRMHRLQARQHTRESPRSGRDRHRPPSFETAS